MDMQAVLKEADDTFTEMIQVLSSAGEEQINIVPFEGSWTAGQNVQHVILSAGGFVQLLNGPVIDTARDPEQNIAALQALFSDYSVKMQSPDFIKPEEKSYNKHLLIDTLTTIKSDFIKVAGSLDITKTCLAFEIPGAGHITRAEAIAFTVVHTQRHTHQLKNIIKSL